MSERSISQYFEYLGAPLVNVRWSWGASSSHTLLAEATDEQGGPNASSPAYVVLRIWQDRCERRDGTLWARVTHHDKYMDYDALGWKERLRHIELTKAGTQPYFIMCRVEEPNISPKEIASFDGKTVFVGGSSEVYDEDVWIQLVDRQPASFLRNIYMEVESA